MLLLSMYGILPKLWARLIIYLGWKICLCLCLCLSLWHCICLSLYLSLPFLFVSESICLSPSVFVLLEEKSYIWNCSMLQIKLKSIYKYIFLAHSKCCCRVNEKMFSTAQDLRYLLKSSCSTNFFTFSLIVKKRYIDSTSLRLFRNENTQFYAPRWNEEFLLKKVSFYNFKTYMGNIFLIIRFRK